MARKVEWSDRAVAHLADIAAFISKDSPDQASLTVSRIMARLDQVADFPHSGRSVPEYGNPDLREVLWQDYRIVYRVYPERIIVAGVAHGSVNLEGFLEFSGYL